MESAPHFAEVVAYEQFMGPWSRAVAGRFLNWLQAPAHSRWLDVGCGTGILSEMSLSTCAPVALVGVDSTPMQIAYAMRRVRDRRAHFQSGDAQALPFADGTFDVAAAALLLNFVPDPRRAVAEMHRVVRPGGLVAAYVWDFEPELSPSGPLRKALRAMGIDVPPVSGTSTSTLPALIAMFGPMDFTNISATSFEVETSFVDFSDFWNSQTTSYSPTTRIIAALDADARKSLFEILRTLVSIRADGTVAHLARANAIKAQVADATPPPPRGSGVRA